jgi:probable DNA metabolism protein
MRVLRLAHEVDLEGFRAAARAALAAGARPEEVRFIVGGQDDLFAAPDGVAEAPRAPPAPAVRAPRRFVDLVDQAGRHRDPARFDLLYRALWRLRGEPGLMEIASDPLVRRLDGMARAARRDRHKMTAFVRFREQADEEGPRYLAWFEPEHFVEEWAAPFFVDRFAAMRFAILTPRVSILWARGELAFGPGARRADAPAADAFSGAWDAYYRAIFNPARLSPKAMLREMPKKYWRDLPETRQAPALIAGARARQEAMLAAPPQPPPAGAARIVARFEASRTETPASDELEALGRAARDCRRCPLGGCATQTVFGEGPREARAILVGEQPGDREDLAGRPFVGPAGGVLEAALRRVGLPREALYLTNAVKHFKHEPRGKRRLHKTPNAGEIDVCRWWLERELALVAAPVVVAMGASALRGVAGPAFAGATLADLRGRTFDLGGRALIVTVHPSFLLRLPDAAARAREPDRFAADLARAADIARAAPEATRRGASDEECAGPGRGAGSRPAPPGREPIRDGALARAGGDA